MPARGLLFWANSFVNIHFRALLLAMLVVFGAAGLERIHAVGHMVEVYEPHMVASALAAGYGFSYSWTRDFDAAADSVDDYQPSAWVDPVYPFIYAGAIRLLGENTRWPMLVFSLASFLLATAVAADCAQRLAGAWAGLATAALLMVTVQGRSIAFSPEPLAMLLVALVLRSLLMVVEQPTKGRIAGLGALLGVSTLTWSSAGILAIPIAITLLLSIDGKARPIAAIASVAVISAALVAPWTLRNFLVFDELVPVRNGAGYLAIVGTAGIANTFASAEIDARAPPPWTAGGPREAMSLVMDADAPEFRRALTGWQGREVRARHGAASRDLNEAQRDQLRLREALRFVGAFPAISAHLGALKLAYFVVPNPAAAALAFLALAGGIVAAWHQRLILIPLGMALAYALPFALMVPLYYRYRMPIEPALAVAAGAALGMLVERSLSRIVPQRPT